MDNCKTLKMARIAGLDAAVATDRMTNAIRGFNMEINTTNAQRIDDVYSRLAAISASNVDEISTAMTIRGEKKVVKKIAGRAVVEMKKGTPYMVVYGDREDLRDQMRAEMTALTGYAPVDCYQIGAAVAANAGPTVVGVIFQENW